MAKYYTSTRFRPQCVTCGLPVAKAEENFKRLQEQGKTPAEALDALGLKNSCCRVQALYPVVLPLGGFYLPHHEAAMLNYLGFKEPTPEPNLVVMSLRRAVTGEHFLTSHVDENGFIGEIANPGTHEPTEVVITTKDRQRSVAMIDGTQLTNECEIRIQTEPGEISRNFPFETRAFRRDIQVDRVRSYFDLVPQETPPAPVEEDEVIEGTEPTLEEMMAADEAEEEDDEPLVTTS